MYVRKSEAGKFLNKRIRCGQKKNKKLECKYKYCFSYIFISIYLFAQNVNNYQSYQYQCLFTIYLLKQENNNRKLQRIVFHNIIRTLSKTEFHLFLKCFGIYLFISFFFLLGIQQNICR